MCYYTKYTPCTHLVDIEFKSDELVYTKVNGYKIYFLKMKNLTKNCFAVLLFLF